MRNWVRDWGGLVPDLGASSPGRRSVGTVLTACDAGRGRRGQGADGSTRLLVGLEAWNASTVPAVSPGVLVAGT